ncbi:MAG: endolytic transglycosylase MltG [Propionibacteriaceae bacterium]|nr:endolytic transglycosylase MltG [Propionibacteriaceae bacterium]
MADRDNVSWISSETSRRAKSAVAVALSFVVLLAGLGLASWKGYSFYMDLRQQDDYIGAGEDPIQVVIRDGDGWARVADSLMALDVIKDPSLFETEALKFSDGPQQAGTWNLLTHLPAATAASMLNDPKNLVVIHFTVPEGTRLLDLNAMMIDQLNDTQDQIDQAMAAVQADPSVIGLNPAAGNNPEGFLFPDTYFLYPPINTDPISVYAMMAKKFTSVVGGLDVDAKAAELGLTIQQIVVVASIIEAEVNNPEDGPKVARAIYNRIADGIPLGVESVFRYGRLMADGTPYNDPITASSQQDGSLPYNYYVNTGLPSTPINSPGQDSLSAALNPAEGDWIYWVTVNLDTGQTEFASDEAGFLALEAQFNQWCADNGEPAGCS